MLDLDRLTVRFGPKVAVDAVSLTVADGSVLAVLGPSGCGKSTLLRAVAGLETPSAGSVALDGVDLAGVPTHRRGFAMMFQDGQLFAHLDVAGNVAYPLARHSIRGSAARAEVERLLALVGLPGYAARRPATLSGGEAQRVALARALAARPRLLLLDEPLSALDRSLRERLALDLRRVLVETGTTALLVTHDHDEAFALADRTALLRDGRLVQEGPTEAVWRHPADAEAALFLGYEQVLSGAAADRVVPAVAPTGNGGRLVALRRGAARLDPHGDLEGTVGALRPGPEGRWAVVELDGIGPVTAAVDGRTTGVGDRVRVRLDPGHCVVVPR